MFPSAEEQKPYGVEGIIGDEEFVSLDLRQKGSSLIGPFLI